MKSRAYNHKEKTYNIFFGTLANKNRLKIIDLLRKGKKNVSEISRDLGFDQTMVSHNLKRLERCGFVFVEQNGKYRTYSLNRKTIKPLMNLIDSHMDEFCSKLIGGRNNG